MNSMWIFLVTTCCIISMLTDAKSAAAALLQSGTEAVQLLATLLGSMVMWSGLMEILCATGDVARLGRVLRKVLSPLFPGIGDEACWAAMGMNIAANMLGLGNAATPAGIRAAQLLARQGECGMDALAMLLVMNNAGLQLMPTTVITLRSAAGAANPADVWLPSLVVSVTATVCGCLLLRLVLRGGKRYG